MTGKNKKIELLSPAGSYEALMAAIKAGCDAVYFGVEQLNMRARSSNNFTLEDLKKIAEIGEIHRIRTYLTLNTVLYDHDIALMKSIVNAAKEIRELNNNEHCGFVDQRDDLFGSGLRVD